MAISDAQLGRRVIIGGLVGFALLVGGVAYCQVEHPSLWRGHSESRKVAPSDARLESAESAAADDPVCRAALPVIKQHCPKLGGYLQLERCEVTAKPKIAFPLDQDRVLKYLGEGIYINLGNSGPEWFLTKDGNLLTANGIAAGHCAIPGITEYAGEQLRKTAPERAKSAAEYEGVWGEGGDYRHPDCSRFELGVAQAVQKEFDGIPAGDDSPKSEQAALARAARATGLEKGVAGDIWQKVSDLCEVALQ